MGALITPKLEDSLRKGGESKLVDSGAGGEVGILVDDCCGYLAKPLHAGARLCSGRWQPEAGNVGERAFVERADFQERRRIAFEGFFMRFHAVPHLSDKLAGVFGD